MNKETVNVGLVLLLAVTSTHCDLLTLLQTSCPNTPFCTTQNSSDTLRKDGYSCCLDCYCDAACTDYGDCCPDSPHASSQHHDMEKARCISNIVPNGFVPEATYYGQTVYRMYDTCPSQYTDAYIVGKCEEETYDSDRSNDDASIVSGPNQEIYRNHYCALCHTVTDTIRWQLNVVGCRKQLHTMRLKASTVNSYIMQNCMLVSLPPDSLSMNSRLLSCSELIESECRYSPDDIGVTNETIDGCLNGPFMPFSTTRNFYIYKNAMCHRCRQQEEVTQDQCKGISSFVPRTNTGSLTKLLNNVEDDSAIPEHATCEENEVFDYHTNECVPFYCPPLEAVFYGTCHPFALPGKIAVRIWTVFWTSDTVAIPQPIRKYNESSREVYASRIQQRFSELDCPGISVSSHVKIEPASNILQYLLIKSEIGLDDKRCTIRGIAKIIRSQPSLSGNWPINDQIYSMKGHDIFIRDAEVYALILEMNILFSYSLASTNTYLIDGFMLCPYIEIDLDRYNAMLTAEGSNNHTEITSLTIQSETLKGMYAISESRLAVCLQPYLHQANSGTHALALVTCTKQMQLIWIWLVAMFFFYSDKTYVIRSRQR